MKTAKALIVCFLILGLAAMLVTPALGMGKILGKGKAAKASTPNVADDLNGGFIVYPTNDLSQDPVNIQWAIDNSTGTFPKILLKSTNLSGTPTQFNFGVNTAAPYISGEGTPKYTAIKSTVLTFLPGTYYSYNPAFWNGVRPASIFVTKDVEIAGESGTKILGGYRVFNIGMAKFPSYVRTFSTSPFYPYTPLPLPNPYGAYGLLEPEIPDANHWYYDADLDGGDLSPHNAALVPVNKVTIRNIEFDSPLYYAINLSASSANSLITIQNNNFKGGLALTDGLYLGLNYARVITILEPEEVFRTSLSINGTINIEGNTCDGTAGTVKRSGPTALKDNLSKFLASFWTNAAMNIKYNTISNTTMVGISLFEFSKNIQVENNAISLNPLTTGMYIENYGIVASGRGMNKLLNLPLRLPTNGALSIKDNTISVNGTGTAGEAGIAFKGITEGGVTILNNNITVNPNARLTSLTGGILVVPVTYGVPNIDTNLCHLLADSRIEGNTIKGTGNFGIFLYGASEGNTILNNDLSLFKADASYATTGAQILLDRLTKNNVVSSNRIGTLGTFNPTPLPIPPAPAGVLCLGDSNEIAYNDFKTSSGIMGLKTSEKVCVYLAEGINLTGGIISLPNDNFVKEQGDYPIGTGGATFQVIDRQRVICDKADPPGICATEVPSTPNRVVGLPSDFLAQQEGAHPGIGQLVKALVQPEVLAPGVDLTPPPPQQ